MSTTDQPDAPETEDQATDASEVSAEQEQEGEALEAEADAEASTPGALAASESLQEAQSGPPSKSLAAIAFLAVALLLVGAVVSYQALNHEVAPERSASIGAKLVLAAGEVTLLGDEGDEGQGERLLSGTPLTSDAKLRTGTGARALIRLSDGSRVFLDGASSVALSQHAGVELLAGRLWLETPALDAKQEPLVHRVGAAKLALSDGGASLRAGEDAAELYIAQGVATVTGPGGPKEVSAGQLVKVGADGLPSVEPVAFWTDWTGGMAGRRSGDLFSGGSGSLYAVDRMAAPGTPSLPLQISSQIVDIALDGGLAETRVDQRFFNPGSRDVEGWYWFTIPEGATLVSFALETNGRLVEGEIVEKKQAVATYERAVVSNDNPALLEWIDERTVRARVYPVPAMGERRVVVRYQQLLSEARGKLRYSYPLAGPSGKDAPTIEEFSLAVELRGDLAQHYSVSTLDEATVANGGRLITMRRTGFVPRADFELELVRREGDKRAKQPALRLSQYEGGEDQARFVMLRWLPDQDFSAVSPRADVVVVVDTSAYGDSAEHQSRVDVAEALLRSLSSEDNFALMAADLSAEVLYPAEGLESASDENIAAALASLRNHRPGGATDLGAIFERALTRVHDATQPAVIYVGDGLATSGERGADALAERLRRALSGSRARLFSVGVGAAVDERLLARLAQVGGGESLRVASPDQAVVQALALSGALKTPTITDLELELGAGLDDRFDNVTGKLARGQELVVLARTHHELPEEIRVRGRLGDTIIDEHYPVHRATGPLDQVVPKLWAAARIERLLGDGRGPQAVRGKVLALGLEYGLMTPFTSFLALESESAYARQGVERRTRPWNYKLLGAVLPTDMNTEDRSPFDDRPSTTELIIGAASAPFGCDAGSEQEDAPATGMQRMDDSRSKDRRAKGEESKIAADSPDEPESAAAAAPELEQRVQEEEDAAPPPPPSRPMPAKSKRSSSSSGYARGGGGKGGDGGEGSGDMAKLAPGSAPLDGIADDFEMAEAPIEHAPEPEPTADPMLARDEMLEDALSPASGEAIGLPKSQLGTEAEKEGFIGGSRGMRERDKDRAGNRQVAKKVAQKNDKQRRRPKVVSPVARNQKQPCSDASARPLTQRKSLWEQRLAKSSDMIGRLRNYETAAASCELESWPQQRVFLQLLQLSAATEAELELLLAHFEGDPEARSYLARALLRRLAEPALVGAVERSMFGGVLDWRAVAASADRATSAGEALAEVELALAKHAEASEDERMPLELVRIDLMFELGRTPEAISSARRLRDRGLITPLLAQRLGELLVAAGEEEEARRVFSEIVEYDPKSPYTRRLLGDIFMRHGWHEAAQRQYGDLVSLTAEPLDYIRLARAVAGAGLVDHALSLLREVAGGDGRPGMDDPRRYARLHAAVLLAELHEAAANDPELPRDKIEAEIERLGLFDGTKVWTFIVWEDLEQELVFGVDQPQTLDKEALARAERASLRTREGWTAGDTGLWAIASDELEGLAVRHRGAVPTHAVAFERLTLRWDGQNYAVTRTPGAIPAREARALTAAEPGEAEPGEAEPAEG